MMLEVTPHVEELYLYVKVWSHMCMEKKDVKSDVTWSSEAQLDANFKHYSLAPFTIFSFRVSDMRLVKYVLRVACKVAPRLY